MCACRCQDVLEGKVEEKPCENGRKVHGLLWALLVDMHRDDL